MNKFFKAIFLVGLLVGSVTRTHYGRQYRQDTVSNQRTEGGLTLFFMWLWGVAQILGLVYVFSNWLNFANCHLPRCLRWLAGVTGTIVFGAANWLLWRSHADLANNWSPRLEVSEDHTLVTNGVFRYIRHPMYAAHWLWAVAQALLLPNWIAGLAGLVAIIPLYFRRVPQEEQLMLEQFGDEYQEYMTRTGRIVPRIF
jgi:protein-S-isoprenylcysteine O-methyltransferase Ste14